MSNPYASNETAQDTADRMTRRVTTDIRNRIRKIFPAPAIFSNEWFELSDVYQHVAAVAVLEERDVYVKPESYVSNTLLNGTADAGKISTIWERDDVCVRLVVEEGKTNLVVRTLEDFYERTKGTNQSSASSVPARLFECATGSLVRCTLTALETWQTLDVRALITHCASVLDTRIANSAPTPSTKDGVLSLLTQEGAVIGYLAHLVVNMERLRNEDTIFEQLTDNKIFSKVLQHAALNLPLLSSSTFREQIQQVSAEGERQQLSASFGYILERDFPANYVIFFTAYLGCEHHKNNPSAVFPGKPEKQQFVAVMEPMTRLMMPGATVPMDLRKATRPLTDAILRFK